jgi:hypothetical protein
MVFDEEKYNLGYDKGMRINALVHQYATYSGLNDVELDGFNDAVMDGYAADITFPPQLLQIISWYLKEEIK